jgi:cyanate permease
VGTSSCSSSIGPLVIGYLKDMTGSFASGLMYVVAMLVMGIICIAVVAARTRVAPADAAPVHARAVCS